MLSRVRGLTHDISDRSVLLSQCRPLAGDGALSVLGWRGVCGSADFGSVDSLTRLDDSYRILGDWGEINLRSEWPSLSIDPDPTT